jgi:hypothetical protein
MAHHPRFALDGFRRALFAALLVNAGLGCSAATIGDESSDDSNAQKGFGVSAEALGINVATNAPGGGAVKTLGAKWARVELVDSTEGPELSSDAVSRVQSTLADYHASGVKVLLVVDYTSRSGFYGGGVNFCPAPQGDWTAWKGEFLSRIEHAAKVFGSDVDAWQIWNEPDHPCGAAENYEPGLPGGEFGLLQRDAYARIKPYTSAPVITGGLMSGNSGYIDDMLAATGGGVYDYADGIAIQIYGVVPNDSWCQAGGLAENEGNLNCSWGRLDGKVHEYGDKTGLPVWVTEVGLKTDDTYKQARYLEDAHAAFGSTGSKLERVFWFAYSDAMVAPFGLTDTSWNPKPDVYATYQMIAGVGSGDAGGDPPVDDGSGTDDGSGSDDGGGESLSCGDVAAKNGWAEAYCEWNGNGACGGSGTATLDCDFCCEVPKAEAPQLSCGEVAEQYLFANPLCEWNGNGACGGNGIPTHDCDFCCDGG